MQPDAWLGPGKGLVASSPLWSLSRRDQLRPPLCQVQPSETVKEIHALDNLLQIFNVSNLRVFS